MSVINENEALLIQSILDMVQYLLDEQGEFLPFGVAIGNNQKITYIGSSNEDEYPSSHDLIAILNDAFIKELDNSTYLLCAICYDIHIKEKIDGIEYKENAVQVNFIGNNYTNKINISYTIDEHQSVIFQ